MKKQKIIPFKTIKYAYFDLDGTLSNSYGDISVKTLEAIKILKKNNIKIGVATGRFLSMFKDLILKCNFDLPIVSAGNNLGYDISLNYSLLESGFLNKGLALEKIEQLNFINLDETIVFGDSYNDIEMFKVAKWSIAMGNAPIELKKYSTYTTKSADEDGIFIFINNYFI